MTHAGYGSNVPPPFNVTFALTGPSDTSSHHASLSDDVLGRFEDQGVNAPPKPPRTSSRPWSSVRISPRSTGTSRNVPLSNAADCLARVMCRRHGRQRYRDE